MKERISATIEEETMNMVKLLLKKRKYRNKSHIIDVAIELLAKEEEKNDKNK